MILFEKAMVTTKIHIYNYTTSIFGKMSRYSSYEQKRILLN